MNFATCETQKIKSVQHLGEVESHNLRLMVVENADPERTKDNVIWRPDPTPLRERVARRIGKKPGRKDAVLAIEVILSMSPEAALWIDVPRFGETGDAWLREHFGAENVVQSVYHLDEKTPHVQGVIIPMVGDRLCAKEFLGDRKQMRRMQDSWARAAAPLGLRRGVTGAKRKHVPMKTLYEIGNKSADEIRAIKDAFTVAADIKTLPVYVPGEASASYAARLMEAVQGQLDDAWQTHYPTLQAMSERQGLITQKDAQIRALMAAQEAKEKEHREAMAELRAELLMEQRAWAELSREYALLRDAQDEQAAKEPVKEWCRRGERPKGARKWEVYSE